MDCPICKVELKMAERQGIEIDYCPTCRGVWLDRGELDKIIEKSASAASGYGDDAPGYREEGRRYEDSRHENHHNEDGRRHDSDEHYGGKKKRKSFLGDIFDFGG